MVGPLEPPEPKNKKQTKKAPNKTQTLQEKPFTIYYYIEKCGNPHFT